jgi:hypothetical protein
MKITQHDIKQGTIIELRINKETFHFLPMGRGDFSRPDFGRLKPPLPQKDSLKRSFITFVKLNNKAIEVYGGLTR